MTAHGGDSATRPDRTGGQPLSSGGSTEELRAQFQARGRPGLAEDRRRDARQARRMYAAFAGMVAVICLVLIVVRLGRGDAMGVWVATYAVGGGVSGVGAVLARSGRTRWALAVTCVAVALASLGDSPTFR
ncbi:hypothetical protein [Streptomyces jeddahensis]|uniref:Uncharacterized protein n=1 Tax=Streptomyces jeddahensis TaxID=1716141 RepID=A0A177HUR0_9ACTN|nr:hypothetical protein [Streptomyces jeddahensis]OAH14359.1 hypothetical protein STSP_23060 [Streptomyces jeddahensis]